MQGRPCRGFSFLSSPKWKETKERCKNVLSSEAESPIFVIIRRTRYAQTASHVDSLVSPLAIQESKKIPKIVHSLKTSSCGMFLKKTWSTKCGYELCSLGLSKNAFENLFEETALLLDSDFSGAVAAVMVLVVDDAELTRGDTVDGGLWVDNKRIWRSPF